MKIITNNDVVFNCGENIELGRWENDPSMDTYKITRGKETEYCVVADFKIYEVDSIPEDYEPNKYCYTAEQGFYLNPDYAEPRSKEYAAGYDQAVLDMMGVE